MSPICTIYLWREREKPRSESLLEFFERKEDLASIFQVFPFHPSFLSDKNFLSMKTQTSHPLSLVFSTQSIFSPNFRTFLSSNSMRPTHPPWISFTHFHPNIMKYFSQLIETCFFMILHENLNLWGHVQNFSFWSKFHFSHMKLVVQPVCQVREF